MHKPHILVCDDEHEISDLIEIFLMQEGYIVSKRDNALNIVSDIIIVPVCRTYA